MSVGNRKWENPCKLNVLVTCSGCCGHETLLEHVITEASLMTWSIKLHSMLMNWMCSSLQVWGGFENCNKKYIQFMSIECNLMLHVISEASVMTCSSSVSWPQRPEHVSNMFNLKGFSHCLFPTTPLKSLSSVSLFISISYKYVLTTKLLTQRGLPFSPP